MNYQIFRKQFFESGCFNINQIYTWQHGFDKNNIWRWVKKKLLIKLRKRHKQVNIKDTKANQEVVPVLLPTFLHL